MKILRCGKCDHFIGLVNSKVEIACPRCVSLNIYNPNSLIPHITEDKTLKADEFYLKSKP